MSLSFIWNRDSQILGSTSCAILSTMRNIIAYTEFQSLGFVALFRCLGLIKPRFIQKIANPSSRSKLKIKIIIVGIWLFVALQHVPAAFFEVS